MKKNAGNYYIYWSFHQLLLFEEGPKRLLQSEYLYCHKELQKKTPVNNK